MLQIKFQRYLKETENAFYNNMETFYFTKIRTMYGISPSIASVPFTILPSNGNAKNLEFKK